VRPLSREEGRGEKAVLIRISSEESWRRRALGKKGAIRSMFVSLSVMQSGSGPREADVDHERGRGEEKKKRGR